MPERLETESGHWKDDGIHPGGEKDIQDSEYLARSARWWQPRTGSAGLFFPGGSLPFSAAPSFSPKVSARSSNSHAQILAAAEKEVDVVVVNKLPAAHRGYGTTLPVSSSSGSLSYFRFDVGLRRPTVKATVNEASQGRVYRGLTRQGANRPMAGRENARISKGVSFPSLLRKKRAG